MNHRRFTLTLPLCLLLAFAAAFLFASPVFAQDEVPPVPVEAPDETPDVPTGEEAPVETALPEALAEAGVVLADESGEPVSLATEEAAELLAGNDPWFKVGTTKYSYMFIGECGGAANCFESDNPIQMAINEIAAGTYTPTDGTLYFDGGTTYNVDGVYIDTVPALKKLVGATDPATGDPTVDINLVEIFEVYNQANFSMSGFNISGNSAALGTFLGTLELGENTGTLNLSDLVVHDAGVEGLGIDIFGHTGSIFLQNVESSNNAGGGLYISIWDDKIVPVTIKNSSFTENGGNEYANGFYIYTDGAVILDGVSVRYNGSSYTDPNDLIPAAFIENSGSLTVKNSVFSNNWASGLVNGNPAAGTVLLENVFANDNRHFIDIDNEFGGAGISLAANGAFTANNVHANGNKFQGMIADTCWSVEVPEGSGNWVCSTTAVGNVVISNSEFSHNYSNGSGLLVDAKGAITLTNVDASWNRGINRPVIDPPTPGDGSPTYTTAGARLNNYSFTTAYPVTVNSSTFDYNSEDGLEITSKGLVTINKVHADNNGTEIDEFGNFIAAHDGYGMDIYNTWGTAGVTFNGTAWGDNSTYGNAYGLRVSILGNILLNYLDSSYNSYTNANLDNTSGAGNVTVNKSTFNHSWSEYGLWVTSRGTVTLNNVTTSENNWRGTVIDNTTAATPKAVKVTGGNFDENVDAGLEIYSHGAITVTNVHVGNNGEKGAFLRNDYLTPTGAQIVQPVTVSGSTFEYNGESGFEVQTFGAITVKNTQSNGNTGHGAYLTNREATAPKAVTISGSSFNENGGYGLIIESKGLVNLSGVDASYNSIREAGMNPGDAVHEYAASQFDDTWWIYANQDDVISITLEHGDDWWDPYLELWGFNGSEWYQITYDDDGGDGNNSQIIDFTMPYSGSYYILAHSYDYSSSGNYTLKYWQGVEPGTWNEVYFYDNNGLTVRNSSGTGVTITNSSFNNNSGHGMDIESYGAVKLTNVNASDNTSCGANINNRDKGATAGITLVGSRFDRNRYNGLNLLTNGAVLLTKTVANDNGEYGATIENTDVVTRKMAVTITNDAAKIDWWREGFSGNGMSGLRITSYGVISLTNVNASDNANSGASLQNFDGLTDIKLTNAVFEDNGSYGVWVFTKGNIIYNKGRANYNGARGASLETYPGTLVKNVTITGVEFYNNYGDGLYVRNNGAITLTNVQANWNYGENGFADYAKGADLNNEAGVGNITIKTSSFNGNADYGLLIATHGNVTLTTVHADNNDYMGALIGSDDPDHLVKVVAISGMSTFYDNGDSGMEVYATGNITLTNVDAAQNGYYGAYLNNTGGTGNVSLLGTLSYWTNWFGENDRTGLLIETDGAVVVNKLDASDNESGGVYINNSTATLPANVTINTGWYNNNTGDGLVVLSKGTVLINSLEASGNSMHGASINNDDDASGTKSVTINKSTFNSNSSNGLQVGSHGNIILNAITASDNYDGGSGAYLYNLGATGTVTVLNTLGANTFNNNEYHGLWIASDHAVIITGVTASFNELGYGIFVDNDGGINAPVTLTKTTTNYNGDDGVYITSAGNVTLNSAVSMFNGVGDAGYGFTILYDHTACKTTISNSVAIGNGGYGIFLYKNGGTYLFTNTLYFGNNVDGGYGNLFITDVL